MMEPVVGRESEAGGLEIEIANEANGDDHVCNVRRLSGGAHARYAVRCTYWQ
jgi:hypothetical protein